MREEVEDVLWAHLQSEIAPQVIKYQVQPDGELSKPCDPPFTPQQFSQLLCDVVDGKDTPEVRGNTCMIVAVTVT